MSRYIDADNLHNAKFQDTSGYGEHIAYRIGWNDAIDAICENAPSIDIVRCKECKYFIDNLTENDTDETYDACRWDWGRRIPKPDDFCSYGEREGE